MIKLKQNVIKRVTDSERVNDSKYRFESKELKCK